MFYNVALEELRNNSYFISSLLEHTQPKPDKFVK